ncbi:MAG TPA: phosphodiester glycosidase family protein [Clostridiaceae bacterium]
MKRFLSKPYRWAAVFSLLLTASFAYVIMDTFVLEKSFAGAFSGIKVSASSSAKTDADVTDSSYDDGNIKITIKTERDYSSTVYIADIQVTDASYLKTAFADGTYGRNIKETTSTISEANNAIFAINGDYYGFRNYGYVLKNGVAYRSTARSGDDDETLVIDKNGDFSIINESKTSLASISSSTWQALSFGPALIENGKIVVNSASEVSQSMSSNPRTAVGQVSALHYIVIVSDGRTSESAGLTLLELAHEFESRGCTVAYNLDGGGSSTMYFNGKVINKPTEGSGISERKVSDIVYFGY